jgi:serine phosphatase RsbU (regulator of sigma subunit)
MTVTRDGNVALVPAPPLVAMATAARCFPSGGRGEPVAGDFFDVYPLDHARTLIAVGDVVGHGVAAAGRMAALRAENRVLALVGLSPAEALRRLDMFQCRLGPEELATLWVGIYDRTTDRLEYASAGHLPPVLADVDGYTRLLSPASAPPLGSGYVGSHVVDITIPLAAGTLLVAYSDGLIERADLDLEDQMEALRGIVEQVYDPPLNQAALEDLVESVLARLPRGPADSPDDVCILAVHRPTGSIPHQ